MKIKIKINHLSVKRSLSPIIMMIFVSLQKIYLKKIKRLPSQAGCHRHTVMQL